MRNGLIGGLLLGAGVGLALSPRVRRRAAQAIGDARERIAHREDVPDDVLEKRVRAALRQAGADDRGLGVAVAEGNLRVSGEVTDEDRERILQAVERVPGVREVADELSVRLRARVVRARRRVLDDGEERWPSAVRLATGIAGGAATLQGMRRRGPLGSALGMVGASMLRRAVAGRR